MRAEASPPTTYPWIIGCKGDRCQDLVESRKPSMLAGHVCKCLQPIIMGICLISRSNASSSHGLGCVSLPMVQSARTWSRLVRANSRGVRGNSNIQRTNARSRPNTPTWLSPMASKSPVWTVSLDTCVSCSETNPSGPLALPSKGRQITGRNRSWISGPVRRGVVLSGPPNGLASWLKHRRVARKRKHARVGFQHLGNGTRTHLPPKLSSFQQSFWLGTYVPHGVADTYASLSWAFKLYQRTQQKRVVFITPGPNILAGLLRNYSVHNPLHEAGILRTNDDG